MSYRMAIRTNRNQVTLWINNITAFTESQRNKMMNMNKSTRDFTVSRFHIDSANSAANSMMSETGHSRL